MSEASAWLDEDGVRSIVFMVIEKKFKIINQACKMFQIENDCADGSEGSRGIKRNRETETIVKLKPKSNQNPLDQKLIEMINQQF